MTRPNKKRTSEREPADSLRDKSNVIVGWLPSLTLALVGGVSTRRITLMKFTLTMMLVCALAYSASAFTLISALRFTGFLRVYDNSLLKARENCNMKNDFVIGGTHDFCPVPRAHEPVRRISGTGVSPVRLVRPTHGRDARATTSRFMESAETKLHPNRATTPRKLLVFAILCTTLVARVVAADTNRPAAAKSDYTVGLRYGKETPLNPEAIQTLYSTAVELLETSNFNSRAAFWDWSISKVHEEYRQTVSGKYLIVSFKAPRKFATVGGEVSVGEIVIGLNRPDYASALFTIDGEGRVVGHAKYDGAKCIELLNAVKQIANDADGGQRRLYFGNSVDCCAIIPVK